MPDFNIRADSVNVEQIMEQIRARIREKRGVDYTEQQIRELAAVKLEKFLDPRGVRSDLLEQFRRMPPPPLRPNYKFEAETMFETHRAPIRWIRRLLHPILKLFFNPNPLIQALHIQAQLNAIDAERESARYGLDQLYYEVIHNLVLETTRLGIEVKNLKMRVESVTSRLEFTERRARALESVVVYKPTEARAAQQPARATQPHGGAGEPSPAREGQPAGTGGVAAAGEGPGQRSRRRRRRRGRRGGGSAAATMGPPGGATQPSPREEGGISGSGPAEEAAREAAAAHDETAETVERALADQSHAGEMRGNDSPGGPGEAPGPSTPGPGDPHAGGQ